MGNPWGSARGWWWMVLGCCLLASREGGRRPPSHFPRGVGVVGRLGRFGLAGPDRALRDPPARVERGDGAGLEAGCRCGAGGYLQRPRAEMPTSAAQASHLLAIVTPKQLQTGGWLAGQPLGTGRHLPLVPHWPGGAWQ